MDFFIEQWLSSTFFFFLNYLVLDAMNWLLCYIIGFIVRLTMGNTNVLDLEPLHQEGSNGHTTSQFKKQHLSWPWTWLVARVGLGQPQLVSRRHLLPFLRIVILEINIQQLFVICWLLVLKLMNSYAHHVLL